MDTERLIELLPLGLYNEDPEARRGLVSLLTPVGQVDDYLDARTRKLGTLLDPAEVPDHAVRHLAGLVGLGTDLAAARPATVAELRKLIPVAVALWKIRGSRPSWRSVVAALAASRALILDWFALRTISGSGSQIAVIPGVGGSGGSYSNPERVSDVWYMDPTKALNEAALIRFLDLARPSGERINLYRALLVDDLGAGAALWAAKGTGSWSFDAEAQELTTNGAQEFATDLDGEEATWSDYHATLRLALSGSCLVRWYRAAAGSIHYRALIDQAAGTVELQRVAAGVTSLGTASVSLVAGHPYLWGFEAWEGTGSTTLRVYLEGAKLLDVVDTAAGRPSAGGVWWGGLGPVAVATLSTALIWPAGTTPTRIGPNP